MAEVLIGEHCSVSSCKQLDFLPCICNGCNLTFCKDHMGYEAHNCVRNDLISVRDAQDVLKESGDGESKSYACSFPSCAGRELVEIQCNACQEVFCLKHRHQADHLCKNIEVQPQRMQQTAQHVQEILAKAEESKKEKPEKTYSSERSRALAARVAVMKLKQTATGDRNIPDADRVYFEVTLPSTTIDGSSVKCSKVAMFVNKTWSVGRAVDSIASAKGLTNNNNVATAKKLCLVESTSGAVYPTSRSIESLLFDVTQEKKVVDTADADTPYLHNGCGVVLKYIERDKL